MFERDERVHAAAKLEIDAARQEARHASHAAQAAASSLARLEAELAQQQQRAPPPVLAVAAVGAEALTGLQARLVSLHGQELLADEELWALEDLCSDFLELQAMVPGRVLTQQMVYERSAERAPGGERYEAVVVRLQKLVAVSAGMAGGALDGSFARQCKRKFVRGGGE